MKKRLLVFIILSVVILFTLSANIAINYFPAQQFYFQAGSGALANKLIGHIGTIVFTNNYANRTANPIINPTMIRLDMDYTFWFNGPMDWDGGNNWKNSDSEFYLIAHTIANGTTTVMPLDQAHSSGSPTPLVSTNFTYTGQVLTIDLYIISRQALNLYELNMAYTLTSGVFGTFRLGVTNSAGWYGGTNAIPLPVGNKSPNAPIHFFDDPSVNPENNPPIYGDPVELITYTFSLLNPNFVPFNLSQATGTNTRLKINEAQMSLSGTKANSTHSVKIKFKDDSNAQSFQLLPLSAGPAPINYNMYFGPTQITKSDEIDWSGLKENSNPNTMDLTIGGINTNSVNSAASGDYKSTISIEIIYPD